MARVDKHNRKKNSVQEPLDAMKHIERADLKSAKLVSQTLLECIRTGDLDAFREALASHIMSTNKLQLSKRTGIGRRTLYDILDPKINFNPELSTVSAIIRGLAE